jgi:hypothetical protein
MAHRIRGIMAAACSLAATGCTTTAYLQGAPGPMASPKAAATVDLADDLYIRAVRIATANGRRAELEALERAIFKEPGDSYGKFCLRNSVTEYEGDTNSLVGRLDIRFNPNRSGGGITQRERSCLNEASQLFRLAVLQMTSTDQQLERNDIQEKLVRASEVGCSLYKKYLNSVQSDNNLLLGSATTLFAAAATIVRAPVAATNWAGAAAMASGVRAEFNADAFNSQAAYVMAKAIDKDRETALVALRSKHSLPYTQYPVEAAVADALGYHDRCSLYRGIQALDESITVVKDPGLRHIKEFLKGGSVTVNEDGSVSANRVQVGSLLSQDKAPILGQADTVADAYLTALNSIMAGTAQLDQARAAVVTELQAFVADPKACPAPCTDENALLTALSAEGAATACPVLKARYLEVFYSGGLGLKNAGCFETKVTAVGVGALAPATPTCVAADKRMKADNDLFAARVALDEARKAKEPESKMRPLRDALEEQKALVAAFNLKQIKPVVNVYIACKAEQEGKIGKAREKLKPKAAS